MEDAVVQAVFQGDENGGGDGVVQHRRAHGGTHANGAQRHGEGPGEDVGFGIKIADHADGIPGGDSAVLSHFGCDGGLGHQHGDGALKGVALGPARRETHDHVEIVPGGLDEHITLLRRDGVALAQLHAGAAPEHRFVFDSGQ